MVREAVELRMMDIKDAKEKEASEFKKEHPYGGPMVVAGYLVAAVAVIGTVAFFIMKAKK